MVRQSVRLRVKPLETHDQKYFFWNENLQSYSLCNTLSDEKVGWLNELLVLVIETWFGSHRNHLFNYFVFSSFQGNVSTELFPSNGCFIVVCLHSSFLAVGLHVTVYLNIWYEIYINFQFNVGWTTWNKIAWNKYLHTFSFSSLRPWLLRMLPSELWNPCSLVNVNVSEEHEPPSYVSKCVDRGIGWTIQQVIGTIIT
jgi:hypothetical protein